MVLNHVPCDLASAVLTSPSRASLPCPIFQPHSPYLPALSPTCSHCTCSLPPPQIHSCLPFHSVNPKTTSQNPPPQCNLRVKMGFLRNMAPKQPAKPKPLLFRNSGIFPTFQSSTQMSPLQESIPRTLFLPFLEHVIAFSRWNLILAPVLLYYNAYNNCIKIRHYAIIYFVPFSPNRV